VGANIATRGLLHSDDPGECRWPDLALVLGDKTPIAAATGLPRDSVVNVTAMVTLNKTDLSDQAAVVPLALLREIDRGLRRVLDL